jgi:HD-like signal output (HDOD) protein
MTAHVLGEEKNLRGDALNAQRFKMLADIAEELKERVVFPVCFDVTISIRSALQKCRSREQLEALLRLDPLICARLLRAANSAARRHKKPPVVDLGQAIASLDIELVRQLVNDTSTQQLFRSRLLADFSDWTELLWERTLTMAAAAHVIARKYSGIDPGQAVFAALCHDMSLYYMLYRAAQYPELCARPASLKHLVINWYGGVSESLLNSLGVPQVIVGAVCFEPQSLDSQPPKTLGDIVHISNVLAVPLAESPPGSSHDRLIERYQGDQAEILAFQGTLRALYS